MHFSWEDAKRVAEDQGGEEGSKSESAGGREDVDEREDEKRGVKEEKEKESGDG